MLALEPAASETSEDVDDDPDRISKIRARHLVRNKLVVTAMVADRRASATREQEAFHQNMHHHQITRHHPVQSLSQSVGQTHSSNKQW